VWSSAERDVLAFLIATLVALSCALVTTGASGRRTLGPLLALAALGTLYLVPASHPIIRTVLGIYVFVGIMRIVDLRAMPGSAATRLKHVLGGVDSRKIRRVDPSLDGVGLLRAGVWSVPAGVFLWLIVRVVPAVQPPLLQWLARWVLGLGFIYTLTEAAYAVIVAGFRAVGIETPTLHRHPIAARSVKEFWGTRWNRTVSTWLDETFFRPFARRGRPRLGLVLAFVVSAAAHAYMTLAAVGPAMAGLMLGYFLLQGVIIVLEFLLGMARWGATAAHAWTILWMVGSSPLFTEPFLRMIGV
jgi:hypothetical protein